MKYDLGLLANRSVPSIWDGVNLARYRQKNRGRLKPITFRVDEAGCWNCTSHSDANDYPHISLNGRQVTLATLAREIVGGDKMAGPITRHTCDNRLCINPEHVLGGTYRDNAQDAIERDRFVFGERNGLSKLTAADVVMIANNDTQTMTALATKYGVSRKVIYNIKNNKSWQHVLRRAVHDGKAHVRLRR